MAQLHSILNACLASYQKGIIALSIGLVLFSVMERVWTLRSANKPLRAYLLDLQYALLSMLYSPFIYFILSALFAYLSLHLYPGAFHNPDISWSIFAGQLLAVLVVRDILIYIRHRIFHTRFVWAFHSIHHSSEDVNWLSAARFHPAENLIETTGEILLFIACQVEGLEPMVLSTAAFIIGFYNFFIHSNLHWTFGPLRYIFVSPVLHRWHHSDAPAAQDKNFAAMFSCLDLALGTFYMPKGVIPETTGLSPEEKSVHPPTFAAQLLYPFRKRRPAAVPTETETRQN